LLRALLLLSFRCAASKHLVKESHDDFLSLAVIKPAGENKGENFSPGVSKDDTTYRSAKTDTKVRQSFCVFVLPYDLLQHFFDESIDVDARGVEELNAVVFFGAKEQRYFGATKNYCLQCSRALSSRPQSQEILRAFPAERHL
jgi:hypothetical protein